MQAGTSFVHPDDSAAEPLTKAKLFTATAEDGSWTEMGIGTVSVVVRELLAASDAEAPQGGSGKVGKAAEGSSGSGPVNREAKLQMVALDSPEDVLLSTPLALDDIYMVQHESILVWSDPELGRNMACSFNTKEGCDSVMRDIQDFQRGERRRVVGTDAGAKARPSADRWTVHPGNLVNILDSVVTDTHRFGIYVRDHDDYFEQLAALFEASVETGDTDSLEAISLIVLALLRSPYNTEGKIIAQFVETTTIDKCIDIVQYGIGKRDKASGFISFAERRATFRDPCHLPQTMLSRIHVLYSCGYLKDLLPLSLDEGDAMSSSLLSTFLMRFKYTLIEEICSSETVLPDAFRHASEPGATSAEIYRLAAFVNEMARTIKNSMIPLDPKESLFRMVLQAGVFGFINVALRRSMQEYVESRAASEAAADGETAEGVPTASQALQMACDTISHCITMLPTAREELLRGASTNPRECTLTLLMQCVTVVQMSCELQAVYDAIVACGMGLIQAMIFLGGEAAAQSRREVVKFWVEGDGIDNPPLFSVAKHVGKLLEDVTASASVAPGDGPSGRRAVGRPSSAVELQLHYCLRVMVAVVREAWRGLCDSLAQLLRLSKVFAALSAVLRIPARRLANIQSSVLAFLNSLLENGDARLLELLRGGEAVLDAVMSLYLCYSYRNNILCSVLLHFFQQLCDGVHSEKARQGRVPRSPEGPSPYVTIMHSEDSVNKKDDDAAQPPVHVFQEAVSGLVETHGSELMTRDPVLATQLCKALEETPEEAQLAEAETSSIASALDRSVSGLSEFEAMALEMGMEAVLSRSPSTSPVPPMDNPHAALLEMMSEDSVDSHFFSDEEEEGEERVEAPVTATADGAEAIAGRKHQRATSSGEEGEGEGGSDFPQKQRQRSEDHQLEAPTAS